MNNGRSRTKASCAAFLAIGLLAQQIAGAQGRQPDLVSRAELRSALRSAAERREANLKQIRHVLEDADVARAGGRLADVTRVSRSLTALDDRTLERLSIQSSQISEQLRAEGPGKVLLIVVLVLVILAAIVSAALPESS
jgi:hypothetical protein